jgi:hypothetical protein
MRRQGGLRELHRILAVQVSVHGSGCFDESVRKRLMLLHHRPAKPRFSQPLACLSNYNRIARVL